MASMIVKCKHGEIVSFITGERDILDISSRIRVIKTFLGCEVYFFVEEGCEIIITLNEDECRKFLDGLLCRAKT